MLWVSQPWRPWIRVFLTYEELPMIFSKPHLAEVMPWLLSQDSFKTIVRPQIHRAGFQHRQFKHEHIRQENTRRIWSEISRPWFFWFIVLPALSLLVIVITLDLQNHFGRWLFRSYWLQYNKMGWHLKRCAGVFFFRGHVDRFLVILPWLKDGCPKASTGIRCPSKWQGGALTWAPTVTYWTSRKKLETKGQSYTTDSWRCIFYTRFVVKWGAFLNFFVRFWILERSSLDIFDVRN